MNDPTHTPAVEVRKDLPPSLQTLLAHAKSLARTHGQDPYYQGRRDALLELYTSGGLPQAQLGLEILFLLPDHFITFYQQLWDKALQGHGESRGSQQVQKAAGNSGTVLGSETRLQAQAGGKKYRVPPGSISSEKALTVKREMDKQLDALVNEARGALYQANNKAQERQARLQCTGSTLGARGQTRKCTRFLKTGWKFCPECGTGIQMKEAGS